MKRIEQKVYYRLKFSMGAITEEEVAWIREAMDKLEKNPAVMKCFQNTMQTNFERDQWQSMHNPVPDFTIYYKGESVEAINKFLFKMQLRFSNFVVHTTQTLQEHF